MITLSAADGDGNVDIRSGQKTYYLVWEHGDLGDPSYRYRDAPKQKDYEWDKLAANVAGGVALSLGLGLVTYGFGTLVVSGSTAAGLGISVCISGTWYTGMQAVSDAVSGRVSSSDTYLRKALAGSIVGFLSGASALASAGAGLGQTMGIAFAEGFAGDAISQHIIDGEIKWDQAIASGAFSSLMAGALWSWRNPGVKVTEGAASTKYPVETETFLPDEYYQKFDDNIANAVAARDAEVSRIQSLSKTQQSKIATVVGGVDLRTGEVYVGVKNSATYAGNATCAEDIAFRGLGGNEAANIMLTPAIRPRTGEIIPVCPRCQTKYPISQFTKGTLFDGQ